MYKIRLLLADFDDHYVHKVAEYINSSFPSRIKLSSFTKINFLRDYLQSNSDKIDILLAHPEFLRQTSGLYKDVELVVVLSDGRFKHRFEEYKTLHKYQPGDQLVNQLINLYSRKNTGAVMMVTGSSDTQIIPVYSAAGGTGKTSIVLGLAAMLSETGKSVLCLSLETISSVPAALSCSGNSAMTQVILSLRENADTLPVQVETYKSRDHLYNIDYLEPPDCFLVHSEINNEDLRLLLGRLKEMGKYDVILIDLDSAADEKTLTIFDCSDRIVLVEVPDQICRFKTEVLLSQVSRAGIEQADLFAKFIPLMNKCNGEPITGWEQYGLKTAFSLPVCPNLWIYGNDKCIFDLNRSFRGYLLGLAKNIAMTGMSGGEQGQLQNAGP